MLDIKTLFKSIFKTIMPILEIFAANCVSYFIVMGFFSPLLLLASYEDGQSSMSKVFCWALFIVSWGGAFVLQVVLKYRELRRDRASAVIDSGDGK
jgi:hypothetical protein